MGALTVTSVSTFTSCKDYDSDISNLQGQIDKAALKTEVEAMKTTVEAAKTAAESAKTTAEKNATDLTDVKAKAEKLATQVAEALQTGKDAKAAADEAKDQCDELELKFFEYYTAEEVDKALDKLEAKIDANTESIEDLKAEVESYSSNINKLYSAVTEVSLVGSFTNGKFISVSTEKYTYSLPGNTEGWDVYESTVNSAFDLSFVTGKTNKDNDFVFGTKQKDDAFVDSKKNYANDANTTYKYAKNTQVDFPKTIVVRVNPVNANVTPDMIKLIDSKGNDLDGVIKVKSVAKYDQLLSRATATGLWTVELAIADGVDASKVEQKDPNNQYKHTLYALGVNNTASATDSAAASRYVVSTYDITIQKPTEYTPADESALYGIELKSETQQPTWTPLKEVSGRGVVTGGTHIQRSSEAKDLLAANGENIYVHFNTQNTPAAANIDRFYIVRDDNHAETASSPSEINVWKSYQYSQSLGDIVEVKNGEGIASFAVTIPSNLATGDQIAFRIFAVNYDGTLVCPTGESFNVTIVNSQTAASVAGDIVATTANPSTEYLPITGTLAGTVSSLPGEVTVNSGSSSIKLNVVYAKDTKGTTATEIGDVKYAKFTVANDNEIKSWKDDATYTGNIKSTDANGAVVNNITVSLTKKLPTANEKKYKWKENQLVDGTFIAYLFPDNTSETSADWTTLSVEYGKKDMNSVITGLTKGDEFTIDGIKLNDDNDAYSESNTFSDNILAIPATKVGDVSLIDNKTVHKMTISKNYGKVSSESADDVVVAYETVNVIFADPTAKAWQTIDWADIKTGEDKDGNAIYAKGNYLTYGKTETLKDTKFLALFKMTNKLDNTKFGGSLKDLLQGISSSTFNAKYKSLVSVTDKSKYFEFEINDSKKGIKEIKPIITSNPNADVTTTLEIVLESVFGEKYTFELPFTVKRAE